MTTFVRTALILLVVALPIVPCAAQAPDPFASVVPARPAPAPPPKPRRQPVATSKPDVIPPAAAPAPLTPSTTRASPPAAPVPASADLPVRPAPPVPLQRPVAPPAASSAPQTGEIDPAAPQPRASRCKNLTAGKTQNIARGIVTDIAVSNDGGWCRINSFRVVEGVSDGGWPYDDMIVDEQPQHGAVQIHKLKTMQAIYYRTVPGFVGTDVSVFRIKPSYSSYTLNVTIGP